MNTTCFRIDFTREGTIRRVDVRPAEDRLPVLRDRPWELVAHDRSLIGWRRHDRRLIERREDLGVYGGLVPTIGVPEPLVCLNGIDPGHDLLARVFVRKTQGMTCLVADDPLVLRLIRLHGESLE